MTLFLHYNVNNHIRDGARHLWWPSVLSVSKSVLSKNLLISEPPLCNPGYAPDFSKITAVLIQELCQNNWLHVRLIHAAISATHTNDCSPSHFQIV